jgi:hypothetical protein
METLTINVPEDKLDLVIEVLTELGVTIQKPQTTHKSAFKTMLANMPVWTDEDIKPIEEARKGFECFKPIEW